ncbi:MAG: hypothetical protein N4Q58_01155 [Lactobacillus iners]|jgi:hypothetical protein|nr:hypothetical protein [Lactobacillus iners]
MNSLVSGAKKIYLKYDKSCRNWACLKPNQINIGAIIMHKSKYKKIGKGLV